MSSHATTINFSAVRSVRWARTVRHLTKTWMANSMHHAVPLPTRCSTTRLPSLTTARPVWARPWTWVPRCVVSHGRPTKMWNSTIQARGTTQWSRSIGPSMWLVWAVIPRRLATRTRIWSFGCERQRCPLFANSTDVSITRPRHSRAVFQLAITRSL